MRTILLSLLALLMISLSSFAQQTSVPCGHDLLMEQLFQEQPEMKAAYEAADAMLFQSSSAQVSQKTSGVLHIIPVVFHVMYADQEDNISYEQILDGLRVLNEDFRRLNADASNTRALFQGVAADVEVEFRLATRDPNGNCHSGVNRVQTNLTTAASNNIKSLSNWDNTKYMNVWVVDAIDIGSVPGGGTVLGYAYRPTANQPFSLDGVVIRHDQVGAIGTSQTLGRTFTHEVGHYLGLLHPFQGDNCNGNNDNIADTPPAAEANFGCPIGVNSCNTDNPDLPDQVENYMDYADNDCQNMFTIGQKTVMKNSLNVFALRGDVSSAGNLSATGVSGFNCVPQPFFIADQRDICQGDAVKFSARAIAGNAAGYSWNFPGGSPAASSQENPSVTYNQAGSYPVTLTLTNPSGSSDTTLQAFIRVSNSGAAQDFQLSENFENSIWPNADWSVLGDDDYISFEQFDGAGYQSNKSLWINNFNATDGQSDFLYAKSLDVRYATSLTLRFRHAFATKESSDNDQLRISVSTDCGQNWTLVRIINTPNLRTAGVVTGSFTPSSDADWSEYSVNLNSYAGNPNPLHVRWELVSGGGNNLYLDDINIDAVLSTSDFFGESITVFPNPSQGVLHLETRNPLDEKPGMVLSDMSGRQIVLHAVRDGLHWRAEIPAAVTNGVYVLQITGKEIHRNQRIVLER